MDRTDKQMTFLGDLLPLKLLITIIQNILELFPGGSPTSTNGIELTVAPFGNTEALSLLSSLAHGNAG